MSENQPDAEKLIESFLQKKVLTREEILDSGGSSPMTAHRILKGRGYLSSYNFNSRFYTLREVARFDENGLWGYRKARFSRYGSLPRTIVALVESSRAGMRARELEEVLEVSVAPRLSKLHAEGKLSREKSGRAYLYVSCRPERAQTQLRAHAQAPREAPGTEPLPAEPRRVIAVLVEMLRGGSRHPRNVARRLRRRGVEISGAQVRRIVAHYGLQKKTVSPTGR